MTTKKYVIDSDSEEEIQKQLETAEKPKTIYQQTEDIILDVLEKHNGCTFGELYKLAFPIKDRRVRDAIHSLKLQQRIHSEKCRCGAASVYYKS